MMLKLKLLMYSSSTLAISCEELTHWKRLWCWEGLGAGGGDDRGWDFWMASLTRWTWVWVNSRSWWWTGRPGVLWFMGSQRVRNDWATDLLWSEVSLRSLSFTRSQEDRKVWMFFLLFLSALRHIPGNCCISTDELPWLCGSSSYRAPRTFFHSRTLQTKGWNVFLSFLYFWLLQPLLVVSLKPTLPLQVVHLLKTLLQNSPVFNSVLCWDSDSWRHFLSEINIYCYKVKFFNFIFWFSFCCHILKGFPLFQINRI